MLENKILNSKVYPFKDNEDVKHLTLDLVNKLGIDLNEKDVSIAHRLP